MVLTGLLLLSVPNIVEPDKLSQSNLFAPTTVLFAGMSLVTTALAPTLTLSPNDMSPINFAPAPSKTFFPNLGAYNTLRG